MEFESLDRNDGQHKIFHGLRTYLEDEALEAVYIAVAFFTLSGFNLVRDSLASALDRGVQVSIIAGTDFFQTDPIALRHLSDLLGSKEGCLLGIMAANKQRIFHPKLYCFKFAETGVINIGSANLTGGGLNSNDELSITIRLRQDSEEWQSVMRTFESYAASSRFWTLDESVLSKYEEAHEKAILELDKVEEQIVDFEPYERRNLRRFRLTNTRDLENLLNAYRKSEVEDNYYLRRQRNYATANELIQSVIDGTPNMPGGHPTSPNGVYDRLVTVFWPSTGIYRQKQRLHNNPSIFSDLVIMLNNDSDRSSRDLFNSALALGRGNGIGPNAVSETMHTMYPDRFCVVNARATEVLRRFGWSGKSASSFNGRDYSEFNDAMLAFKDACRFESLNQTDAFVYFVSEISRAAARGA